ncbi:hypothetical protein ZWY2020_042860 [Hordeum vulgare]|nr:hypothetical protein ZWY2020_042860 [Hordeum vulgare]
MDTDPLLPTTSHGFHSAEHALSPTSTPPPGLLLQGPPHLHAPPPAAPAAAPIPLPRRRGTTTTAASPSATRTRSATTTTRPAPPPHPPTRRPRPSPPCPRSSISSAPPSSPPPPRPTTTTATAAAEAGHHAARLPLLARLPRPRRHFLGRLPGQLHLLRRAHPPHRRCPLLQHRHVLTIGYGDITPASPAAKLFAISFVLIGFGFGDVLLSGMVSYVLELQEHLLITAIKNPRSTRKHRHNYIFDIKKGRMRVRMKVAPRPWCVMSVTKVGYGDHAFRTLHGRLFASAWLLVSTLAVARAFLYLEEMRIDKRHRAMANWVLSRDMTVSEFLAADIDNNGYVT